MASSSVVDIACSFACFVDDYSIAAQRLHAEFKQLSQLPLQGCQASPNCENIFQWIAVIEGPKETVYEGGTFFVELNFNKNYPFVAPEVVFLTRIYHCNISNQGKMRLQVISRQSWRPSFGVATVLQSIISLLYNCDPYNSLVPFIGEQYQQQPEEFNKAARIWTERFAH
ncbi:hypothetical protein niasHT_020554 [Heterodera trifolii]|uniref:UBC core domain-containing protein n=1 Tax=Heterodera trifolii TaxID=157864 RepID=A0ABD2J9K3_9BILA